MNTENIQINNHPFYRDSRFEKEKKILEKLVQICGFDTTIGSVSYLETAPTINIGIVDEKETQKDKIPVFKAGSTITLSLVLKDKPIYFPANISIEILRKIVAPLLNNWIEVSTFLISVYKQELGKEICLENLNYWKEIF